MLILLDPGHTEGYNRSQVTPDYAEGTRMWVLSGILKEKLEKCGFSVETTRPRLEDDPSLYERGVMAGKLGADLFLSLHSNAPSKNPDGSYDETKTGVVGCYSQADVPFNRPLTEQLSLAVSTVMQNPDLGSFYKDYPNRPGVDYYGVLRYAAASGCPRAIILEHGFHTNRHDSEFLMSDENLDAVASAEAAVLSRTFGVTPEEKYYRVQVGAYLYRVNAERKERQVKEAGFDCFITHKDEYYRVQAGAYKEFENALKKETALRNKGFDVYISYGV